MMIREREVFERAVIALSEKAADAYRLMEEAAEAGFASEHPVMVTAKELRWELLRLKGDIERQLSNLLLDCKRCHRRVHWVSGVASEPGHWAHAEPAPGHAPEFERF
jgi:hypothetical protein